MVNVDLYSAIITKVSNALTNVIDWQMHIRPLYAMWPSTNDIKNS